MRFLSNTTCLPTVLTLVILLSGLCLITPAQRTPPKPQVTPPTTKKVVVFKGKTVRLPQASETETLNRKKMLGRDELRRLFIQVMTENGVADPVSTVNSYAFFDLQTPYLRDKGWINSIRPYSISTGGNYAAFTGGDNQLLIVTIKAARVGQWLMVDCLVNADVPGSPFTIEGPDGNLISVTVLHEGHLQAFIIAEDTEYHSIKISRNRGGWDFYACEATTPN